ncbi:MAG: NFACT RNA binding domain-containing protein, partial [Thermoplasmatota archaeon]
PPMRAAVYKELFHHGPMTRNEIAANIGMVPNDCSTRLRELRDARRVREVDRIRNMIENQEKALLEKTKEAERTKRLADALYMDYVRIDGLLKGFDPWGYMEDPDGYPGIEGFQSGTDPNKGKISIRISTDEGDEIVDLETSLDLNQNADLLYTRSKTARKKIEGIEAALRSSRDKLERARRDIEDREDGESIRKLRRFWFESYRWCFTSSRILIIGGRDAKTNERIVKKYMRDSDLYAHADLSGASSVILRVDKDREADEASKEQAVHFSILNSKAWHAKVGSAGGYWVLPDQVSRTPQSGEFLAKGSFVIRGKKNFVEKLPMEGAVGTVYVEGVPKVMFGPVDAVKEICQGNILLLRPGRTKKSDIAKVIAKELGGELDQVMSVLPPGGIDMSRSSSS